MSNLISVLQKAFLDGYATSELDIKTMFLCAVFTAVISLFVCLIYKLMNRNSFYNKSFALSLFALSMITSAIILTIQSNIVISLGMVGALSIVRFRTAIKDPMDLVFLFWSISVGIICGAGFAMIAIICSVVLTIGIILFQILPSEKESLMLVVNSATNNEVELLSVVSTGCSRWKVRARNISPAQANFAIEVRTKHPHTLVEKVSAVKGVTSVSLIEHNGDVTV